MILPEKVVNQIKFLCSSIALVEWSGILFYSIEGSIEDPANLVITIEDILPMHKGTSTYTEYAFNEDVIDYMEENEEAENWKMGHIHSHNSMAVYFSGTDWSELEDNAPNHNFYVSLIVNNFMQFCAKVCFIAQSKETQAFTFSAKNEKGEMYTYSKEDYEVNEQKLISYDCKIDSPVGEIAISEGFSKSVDRIIKESEVSSTHKTTENWASGKAPIHMNAKDYGNSWQARIAAQAAEKRRKDNLNKENDDAWNNHFMGTSTEDEEFSSLADAMSIDDDVEVKDIEEFTMFALNCANPVDDYADIDDIVVAYKKYYITPDKLSIKVLDTYQAAYDKWYDQRSDKDDPTVFLTILEGVCDGVAEEIKTSVDLSVIEMLEPVEDSLKRLSYNCRAKLIRENYSKKK